jgi:hypothetical protein
MPTAFYDDETLATLLDTTQNKGGNGIQSFETYFGE